MDNSTVSKLSLNEINQYLKESSISQYRIDNFWIKSLLLNPNKDRLSNAAQERFRRESDLSKQIKLFVDEDIISKSDLDDLYCQRQENARKVIKLYKLKSSVNLDNVRKLIQNKYNSENYDCFDKYKLAKNIEKTASAGSSKFKLIYVNEPQPNVFNLVFNYRLTWVEPNMETGAIDTKYAYTTVVICIDAEKKVFQIRVTKHKGFGKRTGLKGPMNSMADAFDVAKDEVLNLLQLSADDVSLAVIRKGVKELFNRNILVKYEGIHSHTENNVGVQIHFTIASVNADVDYTNLQAYSLLRSLNLDSAILQIKGTWNDKIDEIKQNFIQAGTVTFDVSKNEIITMSNYTQKELDYVLSNIIKNI